MTRPGKYFVVTHQALPWAIPFPHQIIGVEGYEPAPDSGVAACQIISRLLDSETAFGMLRSFPVQNDVLKSVSDDTDVFLGSYRLFLSQEMSADWLSPLLQENRIITPDEFARNWQNIIATQIPQGVDLLIPAPRLLPDTLLGQYSRVHHLDDLLHGVACAIRSGLLEPLSVPPMLQSNTLIPYGIFASRKKIREEFNDRLWWCAHEFYKNHYVPRTAYQRRVIDFVFERVASMAIVQMVIKHQYKTMSCRNIWVSRDGVYRQGV